MEGGRVPEQEKVEDVAKQQQLVESFCGITSSSREEAFFFLESHNWQLDSAIRSFYDSNDDADQDPALATTDQIRPPNQQRRRFAEPEADYKEEEDDDDDEDYIPSKSDLSPPQTRSSAMSSKDKKPSGSGLPASRGIRTLADLNRQPSGTGSDSDSDGPQEYYTGGEKSGMLVQDPSKGNHDVDAIFEQARQMGATQGPIENLRPSSSSRSFTGTGRLLSGETVPAVPQPQQPENVIHNIIFWTDGFTVNDGPLRRFDDPNNASFLESIRKSECPKELEPSDRRSTVHVNLVRREEKCPEPVKRKTPFQGVGRTLGGDSSSGIESSEPSANTAAPTNESSSSVGLSVDDSLPSTSIQLRLADGTRMVARFNHHHTVGDIRSFIDASRPGATRNYHLQTVGFPPKQLADVTQTIEQAGLTNSVVIQKL